MKKFLITAVALAALTAPAFAADLPSPSAPPPAPPPPPPVFSWTGFYIGANGGFGGDQFVYPIAIGTVASATAHLTSSGFVGGGQIGFNYQFSGPLVVGLEADIDFSSINGSVGLTGTAGATTFSLNAGSKLEDIGTVRARLGYAWDRAMLYATGGFAYGTENFFANGSLGGLGSFNISKSLSTTGWTLGAGIEYALTDHVTLKTEYLYVHLNNVNLLNTTIGVTPVTIGARSTDNIVRVGLNYKFGGL